MLQQFVMGGGDHTHATVRPRTICEGDPSRNGRRGLRSRIDAILVPSDICAVARMLAKDDRSHHDDLRPEQRFHSVKHIRFHGQIVCPGKAEMGPPHWYGVARETRFEGFVGAAEFRNPSGREHRKREYDAVAMISIGDG